MGNFDSRHSKIKRDGEFGTLYVVSTPIGNMEDITLRALTVLKDVDLIAAESVEHTKGLCERHGIKTRLTRYNQHNGNVKAPQLIGRLKSGLDIAVVTDAGTPGISDPGVHLIRMATEEGVKITPIPGPSAVAAALSVSGLPSEQFVFLGFLPNRSGKRRTALEQLTAETRTMVFFEAPHRIRAMLNDLKEILGDREMVMLREITKVFEDIKRGPITYVLEHLEAEKARGEFTLVVRGAKETSDKGPDQAILDRMKDLLSAEEHSVKDIAMMLSKEAGLSYRSLYKECIGLKRALGKGGK